MLYAIWDAAREKKCGNDVGDKDHQGDIANQSDEHPFFCLQKILLCNFRIETRKVAHFSKWGRSNTWFALI